MEHGNEHGGGNGGEHGGHGGNEGDCPMIMSFHFGHCETILWKSWMTKTVVQFILSVVAVFAMAFIYEGLKYLRDRYYFVTAQKDLAELMAQRKENNRGNESCCTNISMIQTKRTFFRKTFNKAHLIQTLMHIIQVALSYLLMLIIMTFNYWLCLAVIFGAACGYFCFGWIHQQAIDFNEHCH